MGTYDSNNSLKFLIQCLISVAMVWKATNVCSWKGSKNKKWPGLPYYYLVIVNLFGILNASYLTYEVRVQLGKSRSNFKQLSCEMGQNW